MSWIKLGDGRFRNPIPGTASKRLTSQKIFKNRSNTDGAKAINQYLLTKRNIPSALVWNTRKSMCASKLQQEFDVDVEEIIDDEFWVKKETSCDIELDTNGELNGE